MIKNISIFISVIAIVIAAIGIYQTKKNTKLVFNQFLFSTQLEIVNLYRAVIYIMKGLAFIDLSDNEEYYTYSLESVIKLYEGYGYTEVK